MVVFLSVLICQTDVTPAAWSKSFTDAAITSTTTPSGAAIGSPKSNRRGHSNCLHR